MKQDIQNLCAKKNIRLTPLKEALIEVFLHAQSPLTVPQIQIQLQQKNFRPNKTSLYRHIEVFLQKNVIQKMILNAGVIHYEYQSHHHHHFVCETCKSIQCIEDTALEEKIHILANNLKTKGLTVLQHNFSLSGKCQKCTSF